MATFNSTGVYLNTKSSKNGLPSIYRVPVSQAHESFYFNQDSIKAIVYCYTDTNTICYKESLIASIHLTNKRLILLSQSTSIASPEPSHFDTCELQLSNLESLKTKSIYKKGLRLDIKTLAGRNQSIRIDITFNNKKDANRREALKEYIKMAVSPMLSGRARDTVRLPLAWAQDDLPSYIEATSNANSIAPPAYS